MRRCNLRSFLVLVSLSAGVSPGTTLVGADPQNGGKIHCLGRIKPAEGIILVGVRPGARIDQILVTVDQVVKKGDTLAVLEGREQAERQLAVAKAERERATFTRTNRRALLKVERERFDKLVEPRRKRLLDIKTKLAEKLETLRKNRERSTGLDPTVDRVAIQEYLMSQTQTELTRAEQEVDDFEATLAALPKQREVEDRELADDSPIVKLLDEQVALAAAEVNRTRVEAPSGGVILDVIAHPGEVSVGPLVRLADLSQMTVEVEVDQSSVPRLEIGALAEIKFLDLSTTGKLTRISRLVGKNKFTDIDPFQRVDRRVVEGTVALQDAKTVERYLGMQVDVVLTPREPGK